MSKLKLKIKRDPIDVLEQRYNKNLELKTIKPRFFWHTCDCCSKEFKHTPMYELNKTPLALETNVTYTGCTECFESPQDFKRWLEQKHHILTHDDFVFLKDVLEKKKNKQPITADENLRFLNLQLV